MSSRTTSFVQYTSTTSCVCERWVFVISLIWCKTKHRIKGIYYFHTDSLKFYLHYTVYLNPFTNNGFYHIWQLLKWRICYVMKSSSRLTVGCWFFPGVNTAHAWTINSQRGTCHPSPTLKLKGHYRTLYCADITYNTYPAGTESDLTFAINIEPGQPTHLCSLTRLYTACWPSSSCHLDVPKYDNGQFWKWKVDKYSFKKFSRLRVKLPFKWATYAHNDIYLYIY